MGEPVTTPPPVSVAGLEIPAALAPQIILAFRALYPTITEGKDDDAAVRAVLIYWITSALEAHQGTQANAALEARVDQMRSEYAAQVEVVRQKVRQAASQIKEKAPAPPPEPVEEPGVP